MAMESLNFFFFFNDFPHVSTVQGKQTPPWICFGSLKDRTIIHWLYTSIINILLDLSEQRSVNQEELEYKWSMHTYCVAHV